VEVPRAVQEVHEHLCGLVRAGVLQQGLHELPSLLVHHVLDAMLAPEELLQDDMQQPPRLMHLVAPLVVGLLRCVDLREEGMQLPEARVPLAALGAEPSSPSALRHGVF